VQNIAVLLYNVWIGQAIYDILHFLAKQATGIRSDFLESNFFIKKEVWRYSCAGNLGPEMPFSSRKNNHGQGIDKQVFL